MNCSNHIKQLFLLLQYLYNTFGFVHNDIKYENLGLDTDGNIYLFDFDNFSEISKKYYNKNNNANYYI